MKISYVASIIFLCVFLAFTACFNDEKSEVEKEKERYSDYVENCERLNEETELKFDLDEIFYIELEENATPYSWEYSIEDDSIVEFVSVNSFEFNDEDVAGAPVKKVWKFISKEYGTTVIRFNRVNIGDSSDIIESKEYTLVVARDLGDDYDNYVANAKEIIESENNLFELGDTVYVSLRENGSTGYTWSNSYIGSEILEEIETKTFSTTDDEEIVGASYEKVWMYKVIASGSGTLNFKYARSF